MITLILGAITLLFIAYALLKRLIEKIFNMKICSLCAAVATTWIGMLVLKFIGVTIDKILIGILIGESIAGIMYSLSGKPRINPFIGLPVILFGTTIAYGVIELKFDASSLFVLIPVALIMAIISMTGKSPSGKGKGLAKKLENCCG